MQDFFKYDKIQGGSSLFMKSDNDGSKDEQKRGLPLGIKTTAQGIEHFTSWGDISNSIESRNTTRFDDAQPNSLRFSMNNARAVYDVVDDTNIFPVAIPIEPEHGLLHRQFSKISFEDRWEANDITILDDIAFVSYEDYSDVHRYDIDLQTQGAELKQASTFVDDTENQTTISTMCMSTDIGGIDKIFPLGVQETSQAQKTRLSLDFASLDNTILKIKLTQTTNGGASFNGGENSQTDWAGGSGDVQEIPEVIYLTYGGVLPNIAGSQSLPIGSPHLTASTSYQAPNTVTTISGGGSIFKDINGNNITNANDNKVVGKFYLVVDKDVGVNSNIPSSDVVGIQLDIACTWGMSVDGTQYTSNKSLHKFAGDGHSLTGLKTYKIDTQEISLIKIQPVRKCGKVDIYTRKRGIIDSVSGNTITSPGHKLETNDIIKISGALFSTSSASYADIHPINGTKYVKKIDDDTFKIYDDQFFAKPTYGSDLRSVSGINWTCVSNIYGSVGQSWDYHGTIFSPTGRNGYKSKSASTDDQLSSNSEFFTTKRMKGILGTSGNAGSINLLFDDASEDFGKIVDQYVPSRFNGSSPFDDPKRGPQDFYPYFCANTSDQLIDGLDADALKAKESANTLYTRSPYNGTRFGCSLDFKYSHLSGDSKVYVLAIGERGSDLSVDLFGVEESECHVDTYTTNHPDENSSFYKYGRVRNCNSVSTPRGTKLVQNFRSRVMPWHLPHGKTHVLSVTVDRYGRISDISHRNTLYGGGDSISNDTSWSREYNFPDGVATKTLSEFVETNPWKTFEARYRKLYPTYSSTSLDPIDENASLLFHEPDYFVDLDSRFSSRYWLRAAVLHWKAQDIYSHHFNSTASRQALLRLRTTIPYYRKFNTSLYQPRLPALKIAGFEIYNPKQNDPITNRAMISTNPSFITSSSSRFGHTGFGKTGSPPLYYDINRFRSSYTNNPDQPIYGPPEIGNNISHMSQWYIYPWVDSFGKSVAIKRVDDEFIVLCGSRVKSNPEVSAGYMKNDSLDPKYDNIPLQPSNNISARYNGSTLRTADTETKLGQVSANFLNSSTFALQDFTEITAGGVSSNRYFQDSSFGTAGEVPVRYRALKSGALAGLGIPEVVSSAELSMSKIIWKDDFIIWSDQQLFNNQSKIYFFTYSSANSFVENDQLVKDFIDTRGGRDKSLWPRGVSPAINTGDGFGMDFRYDNGLLVTNVMSNVTDFGDSVANLISGSVINDNTGLYSVNVRCDILELYERRIIGSVQDLTFVFSQRITPSIYSKDAKYSRALLSQFKNSPQSIDGSIPTVPYLLSLNNLNYGNLVDGTLTWNIDLTGRYDVIDRKIILKDPLEYSLFSCNHRTRSN